MHVHGLTSRGATRETWAFADHNDKVINALSRHQINFSPLPPSRLGELGANTRAGGILYAGGEHVDKVMRYSRACVRADCMHCWRLALHALLAATTLTRYLGLLRVDLLRGQVAALSLSLTHSLTHSHTYLPGAVCGDAAGDGRRTGNTCGQL